MGQNMESNPALGSLIGKAQLSFARAVRDFNSVSAGLGLGRLDPGLASAEAGNTACDSGCDGGCFGELATEAISRINEVRTARVSAVLSGIRTAGTGLLNISSLEAALESGNSACDSGCNGGCGGTDLLRPQVDVAAGAGQGVKGTAQPG